jgi:hypothetical protein
MLLQWKMCQKASSRILKKTERTVSVHDQPKVWSRGRGFSKSKIVFQQRTSQISLVLATISSLEDRGSSIPFQAWFNSPVVQNYAQASFISRLT